MKKLIIIVGLPGSGKSFVADVIKKKFKAEAFHSGDIIREEIKRRGWKYTPETDALVAHWFHIGGREKLLIKRVWNKIKKSKKKLIVIEGLRSSKQLKYLKCYYKRKSVIIFIKASFKVRVKRELKRGRFGKQETISYLISREKLEKTHGILGLIKKANYTIDNTNLTKKQFENKIIKLIKKIL
jgi:dephospho-CoA kinase